MVAFGFNAARSVRVSNELGAGHPRTTKFSVVVVVVTPFLDGVALSLILIITRKQYPSLFTDSSDVQEIVITLTPLLAFAITVNNIQPVLSGVAIGAGWQELVAYVNICSYYVFGVPLGFLLAYKFDLGIELSGDYYKSANFLKTNQTHGTQPERAAPQKDLRGLNLCASNRSAW